MKLGYKRDRPDVRDWRITQDYLGVSTIKSGVSWLDKCAPVRDQPAQNCVNEALSRSVHTVAAIKGTPVAYPSCLANYGLGRQLELGPDAEFLPDQGSYPRLVMRAARSHGMVPLAEYGDLEDPNKPVPFDVIQTAWHARLTEFWRVDQANEDLICAAIEAGRIPIMGRQIGQDYLNLGTQIYDGRKTPVAGGHMEAIVGFNRDVALPYFEVMGSWGTGFANGGVALCSIRSVLLEAYDMYVVNAVPREL